MTLAALLDSGIELESLQRGIDSLGLPDVRLLVSDVVKNCFRAKSVRVEFPPHQCPRDFSQIRTLIQDSQGLTARQKSLAQRIFYEVAKAEAKVHGTEVEQVHFHEVGAVDSIVDIVGAAIGFDLLGVERIVCGPLPTGRGEVRIDHGLCPIPTPGTAELLKGIPLRDLPVNGELTTPTGAAIVRVLADSFGPLPEMTIDQIGCGAGTLSLPDRANILRIFVGTANVSAGQEVITLLETNLDDVTGEVIGYTKERLMATGALDVYSTPIQMKKNRPGVLLSVLTRAEKASECEEILFQETGTLGVRRQTLLRSVRSRQKQTVLTEFGPINGQLSWQSNGNSDFSPEFEDCARQAGACGVTFRDVYRAAVLAYEKAFPASLSVVIPNEGAHDHDHHYHDDSHDHGHDHRHDHGHDQHH